jgi:hypothetical protein
MLRNIITPEGAILSIRRLLDICIIILILGLTACNLSMGVPIPTSTPVQTSAPFPTAVLTQTLRPTNTPLPTLTSQPQPTSLPVYNVRQPLPGPICSISPNVDAANVRSGPGTTYSVVGVLPANNWVSAARLDASGWYQVAYAGTVVNGGWISGTVVNLQQPCVCGPNNCSVVPTSIPPTWTPIPTATFQPPPNQCTVTVLTPSDVVNIYYQPAADAGVWDTLRSGGGMVVSGRTNDGWYALGPLNLQGSMIGINTLRWVRSDARINLTGAPCGTLPIIDVSYPAPGDCLVSPVNISSVPIYPQHSFDLSPVGTLASGQTLAVVGSTPPNTNGAPNGWYAIEPSSVQAGTVGRYRLRWIPIDNNVAVTGAACANLPTVTLNP